MVVRELVTVLGFKVDTRKLRAFDARVGAARRNLQDLTGNLQQAATGLRNFGIGLTAAVSVPLGLAGLAAVKTSAQFEQLQVSFETMLGSAERAEKMIKDIVRFAATTPFELLNVQKGAKRLLAYNVEADKVIDTMRVLGDISAGVGLDKLPNLITALGQVQAKTRLSGEELRQFTETGVPLISALAEMTGFAEREIADQTARLGISYDQVFKALESLTTEGGKFNNLMLKQSKTIAGLFSNLQDAFTIFLKDIGDTIVETFKLDIVLSKLITVLEKAGKIFKALPAPIKGAIVIFAALLAALGPILLIAGLLGQAILGIVAAMAFLGPLLPAIIAGFAGFLVIALKVIAVVGLIGTAIWLLIDDFMAWKEGGDSVIGVLIGRFDEFKRRINLVVDTIKTLFSSLWEALNTGNQEAWNTFKKQLSNIGEFISKFIDKVIDKFIELAPQLIKILIKTFIRLAVAMSFNTSV